MTTYAIGDIQGCYDELQKLLEMICFDSDKDSLWFTGDLVNRGPQSLKTLRYIKSLGERHVVVLGNHDLHLLAVAHGVGKASERDTLDEVLSAPDKVELLEWLRHRSLLHYDKTLQFVMVHAGLAPSWTIKMARELAQEMEIILQGASSLLFFKNMYGNQPDHWDDNLQGVERWRCIINFLTRMRFCHADGRLDLTYKGDIANKPADLIPWFEVPDRVNASDKIIFGHWAALGGKTKTPNLYPLDTGCVWGNSLTAMRLSDEMRFSMPCS